MQEFVDRHTQLEEIDGDAVAALAFDYEHTLVVGDLHTVQHDFEDVINTTHHGEWCLETVFCTGPADRIRELVYRLRDVDAVGRVNVMFLQPVGE
jgi:CopG family nickel-responsive transcriptional regulator